MAAERRNLRVGEDPTAYLQEQFGQSGLQLDWDPNNPTPEQSANMLDAIYYGAYGGGQNEIANGDLSGLQNVAQNGLAPTQGPGQYNQFEGGYTDESGQYHLGPSQWEHDSAWAETTSYDELMQAGNPGDARTWVKQQYMAGNLTGEEAQELENQAFEAQFGGPTYSSSYDWGEGNTLSSKGFVTTTYTPTDYSTLAQDPSGWSRSTNQVDVERTTTQDLGGQIFKTIMTSALTAGAGGALAGAGLSGTALGAAKGAIGGATSGLINEGSLDPMDIAMGALTGGLGASLNNPDGMLGGLINTGSDLADDAIKGALLGAVGGAVDGDILEGALYGAAGGAATNLIGKGFDKLTSGGSNTSEWDFASGPEWDENDLMNQDFRLDVLQPVVPGGEYRDLPEWAQQYVDENNFYDKYAPPKDVGDLTQQLDDMYQTQLESDAFDYTQSPEFVGPGANLAAGYDPNTVEGKWMDNLSQDDFVHSNLNFSNSALSSYVNDDRDFWVINTPDGYYLTDADGNMVKYRGGDIGTQDFFGNNTQGLSQYDSLDPLSQHVAAGGDIPGTGQRYVNVDFSETDSVDQTDPTETTEEQPEETETTDSSPESTPTNSTDKTEMGGSSNAGNDGTPSQDVGPSNPTVPSDYVLVGVNSNGERVYENVITNIRVPESELPGEVYAGNPQGDPEVETEPTTKQEEGATGTSDTAEQGGGQNAEQDNGRGGTDSGDNAGDGNSDSNDLGEEGENDGIGDDDDEGKGADDEGSGDPGIGDGTGGSGSGGLGEGLLAGLGGGGSDENYVWQPIAGLTKISPYQKRRHAIYNSLNEGLLRAALQEGRRA
jgi:hypothetical protein